MRTRRRSRGGWRRRGRSRVYGHRLGGEADRQGSAPLQARPQGLYIALPSEASSALWVRHGVNLVCSCDD